MLCFTGAGTGIVSDTVQVQRYGKIKKYKIRVRLYIIIKYIKNNLFYYDKKFKEFEMDL
jgi:hypothetical protein